MIFLPYKIDVSLTRTPFVTFFIIIVCSFIFNKQINSRESYDSAMQYYCNESLSSQVRSLIGRLNHSYQSCATFWQSIKESDDPKKTLYELTDDSNLLFDQKERSASAKNDFQMLFQEYQYFEKMVPNDLTSQLQYMPGDLNPIKMITSTFSHGSWSHLIGNMLFFYVFAAAIEIIVGSLTFIGVILIMSITTSLAYSISVLGDNSSIPTIGISGVVMGMMAMLALLVPKIKIKCFFWFIIIVKVFRIPALFLAIWYVGWDFYDMKNSRNSGIDYVAHVSGALTGLILAFIFVSTRKKFVRQLRQ